MTVKELMAAVERYPAEFPVHVRVGTAGHSVVGVKQGVDHGVAVAELRLLPHDEPVVPFSVQSDGPSRGTKPPHKKPLGKSR